MLLDDLKSGALTQTKVESLFSYFIQGYMPYPENRDTLTRTMTYLN